MAKTKLKIAIVHDYIKEFGGAESVLETLSDIFPDAPIYTTLYCPKFFGPHRDRLEKKWSKRIHQSFFKFIPFAPKVISPLRLLSPLAFRSFDFSKYDIIITSATGAYFPNSLDKKNAKLVCYCHTPPRYLYGLPTARVLSKNRMIYFIVQFINHYLRIFDFKFAQNVDQFIANSQTTSARIQKFYRREAIVINPPIEIPEIKIAKNKISEGQRTQNEVEPEGGKHRQILSEPYYLAGGRLARAKRYDVAIEACNKLGVKLKIFGRDFAGFVDELKTIAGPNIEFLGEINQSQKHELFSNAQAFIFCSDNEDFGMVPVEAMAYGCPVVGYRSGGTTETVLDGKTGILFDELTPDSCAQSIKKIIALTSTIKERQMFAKNCMARAKCFSKESFIGKIQAAVSNS